MIVHITRHSKVLLKVVVIIAVHNMLILIFFFEKNLYSRNFACAKQALPVFAILMRIA